jgi:SHS family lactate transporter-like MFS transporter
VLAAAPALLAVPIRLWVPDPPLALTEAKRNGRASAPLAKKRIGLGQALREERLWRPLIWACAVIGLEFATYYAMTVSYPSLLTTQLHLDSSAVGRYVKLFNLGMLVGSLICGWVAARRGAVSTLLIVTVALLPVLPAYVGYFPQLLAGGSLLAGFFGAGNTGTTPLLLTQLFPEHVRARCLGIVYHVGAAVGAIAPTIVAALSTRLRWGLPGAMSLVPAVSLVLLLGVLTVPPASTVPRQSE